MKTAYFNNFIECEPGTKSRRETSCEPCTAGKYGRKCSYFCNCKINERYMYANNVFKYNIYIPYIYLKVILIKENSSNFVFLEVLFSITGIESISIRLTVNV